MGLLRIGWERNLPGDSKEENGRLSSRLLAMDHVSDSCHPGKLFQARDDSVVLWKEIWIEFTQDPVNFKKIIYLKNSYQLRVLQNSKNSSCETLLKTRFSITF